MQQREKWLPKLGNQFTLLSIYLAMKYINDTYE
jgi:hypothetical protein